VADGHDGGWLRLSQAAMPFDTFDARRNAFIPPSGAEIEKRRRELVDDLRAGRRWRTRWRDQDGRWREEMIPADWWTYDAVNWVWEVLRRGDGLLRVEISDSGDQSAIGKAPVVIEIDPYRTGAPSRRTAVHFVRQEIDRRLANGRPDCTLKDFAAGLCQWLKDNHPEAPQIGQSHMENVARSQWRACKPMNWPRT
jgi:hypothetical protein